MTHRLLLKVVKGDFGTRNGFGVEDIVDRQKIAVVDSFFDRNPDVGSQYVGADLFIVIIGFVTRILAFVPIVVVVIIVEVVLNTVPRAVILRLVKVFFGYRLFFKIVALTPVRTVVRPEIETHPIDGSDLRRNQCL